MSLSICIKHFNKSLLSRYRVQPRPMNIGLSQTVRRRGGLKFGLVSSVKSCE